MRACVHHRAQIERGADPTFSNNVYQSPLDLAETMRDNRVILQALKRAPKVRARGWTAQPPSTTHPSLPSPTRAACRTPPPQLVAERRKRRDSIERAFKEEKDRELAIEMRQFARGA